MLKRTFLTKHIKLQVPSPFGSRDNHDTLESRVLSWVKKYDYDGNHWPYLETIIKQQIL